MPELPQIQPAAGLSNTCTGFVPQSNVHCPTHPSRDAAGFQPLQRRPGEPHASQRTRTVQGRVQPGIRMAAQASGPQATPQPWRNEVTAREDDAQPSAVIIPPADYPGARAPGRASTAGCEVFRFDELHLLQSLPSYMELLLVSDHTNGHGHGAALDMRPLAWTLDQHLETGRALRVLPLENLSEAPPAYETSVPGQPSAPPEEPEYQSPEPSAPPGEPEYQSPGPSAPPEEPEYQSPEPSAPPEQREYRSPAPSAPQRFQRL